MKRFILWAAVFSLPFQSKAQFNVPAIQEDTFQSGIDWDIGTSGLGNVNANSYYLPAYNANLYVTTWDGGEPVYDNKYGGFVVRQYPYGTSVNSSTTPTYQQSQNAFPYTDFDSLHISSLEAGFFQFNGETYIALTYFGINYATPSSGQFYIKTYKWDPGSGTLTLVPSTGNPTELTTSPIPLNATDGWIHQDINDQNQIVVTWDEGGRIFTKALIFNGSTFSPTGTGILDVPVASLGKPDVAMTLLSNGNSDIYYAFTSEAADDAPQEGLWVYKGDYNSLSSLTGSTPQPYAVDSVYHKSSTDGHFGLPRIDLPNTSASSDDAAWSIVVADFHGIHNDIFAASYSKNSGLKEQVLNNGTLGSLPDISLVGVYKNNRPTVAFSPINDQLYYAWVVQEQSNPETYISVKTTTGLSLLNNPSTGYFLIPYKFARDPFYPGVALSTNNTFPQLYTAFIEDPSQFSLQLTLGLKAVDWASNYGYKPSPTGISENENKGVFSLYPNPFRESLQIKANMNTNQDFQIVVFNILGQKVYQDKGRLNKINKGLQSIGETLPSGTYFMKIKDTDGNAFRKKVVKW